MKKQTGFTLIELVIVIIILGILAVTAAPKFINLQDDARRAAAQGVQAAIQSAAQMVYAKSALAGKEDGDQQISINGNSLYVRYGYPTADSIVEAVTLDGWEQTGVSGSSTTFSPKKAKPSDCVVTYTEATSSAIYSTDISNCAQ